MIMNEARSVDLRNQRLGDGKAETLHGCGHGSSVATVIEPTAFHITQDPTAFEGKSPCLTQGNPKTGQATIGVAIPIADKATRYKGGGDTRKARDFKDSTDLVVEMEYIIRRLTPLECCRLQGFPDDWTEDIAITEPKASVIREWMIAWAEWWRLIGKDSGIQLPKDAKQVERWLADPASDSGLYKMWGNGIALPCAMFVMEGIAEVLKEENSNESE